MSRYVIFFFFRKIAKHIKDQDENMALIVIGDHGMTRTGNFKWNKMDVVMMVVNS